MQLRKDELYLFDLFDIGKELKSPETDKIEKELKSLDDIGMVFTVFLILDWILYMCFAN